MDITPEEIGKVLASCNRATQLKERGAKIFSESEALQCIEPAGDIIRQLLGLLADTTRRIESELQGHDWHPHYEGVLKDIADKLKPYAGLVQQKE